MAEAKTKTKPKSKKEITYDLRIRVSDNTDKELTVSTVDSVTTNVENILGCIGDALRSRYGSDAIKGLKHFTVTTSFTETEEEVDNENTGA